MEPPLVSAARGAEEPVLASSSVAAAAEPQPVERRGSKQPSKQSKVVHDPRFRQSWRYVQTTVSKADMVQFILPYLKGQLEAGTLPEALEPPRDRGLAYRLATEGVAASASAASAVRGAGGDVSAARGAGDPFVANGPDLDLDQTTISFYEQGPVSMDVMVKAVGTR